MGYHDRDYYREGSQSTYVTSIVVKLIIVNGIVFLAELLFGRDSLGRSLVAETLAVHAARRQGPDQRADARAHDPLRADAALDERGPRPDVGEPLQAAASEHEPGPVPGASGAPGIPGNSGALGGL